MSDVQGYANTQLNEMRKTIQDGKTESGKREDILKRTEIEMKMELKNSVTRKTQGKALQIECIK